MNLYLDNAATTKLHARVLDKMLPYLKENYGNPSSIHSFGRKSRVAIEYSREIIADFINAEPSEIYFTSSGTEANNFVVNGIAKTEFLESGRNHIITSAGDHKAILNTVKNLVSQGFKSTILSLNKSIRIDSESLTNAITDQTSLVSLIHINNETGSINNIKKLSKKINNIYFHSDAVQSFGKIKVDVKELGIHSLSASAHKLYGPKGIGFAYVKSGTPMDSLIHGGGQERNRRAGTENVAAIVGFAEAVKIAAESMDENYLKSASLKKYLWDGLISSGIEGIFQNGSDESSPYILSITFDPDFYKNDSEAILMFLDINGIAVSAGSACTSGTLKPSHVIMAAGNSEGYAKGTLRFSFSAENTFEEMEYAIEIMGKIAEKIRK